MKLIVSVKFDNWRGYTYQHGFLFKSTVVLFNPIFRIMPHCDFMLQLHDHVSTGYGQGIRLSKPTNPIHDTWLVKLKRFIRSKL